MTIYYGQFSSQTITDAIRLTEAEDIRITEAGDTRITGEIKTNFTQSFLTATGNIIGFTDNAYVKYEGNWESFVPYVKDVGIWKEPASIYIKQSGVWKRVY